MEVLYHIRPYFVGIFPEIPIDITKNSEVSLFTYLALKKWLGIQVPLNLPKCLTYFVRLFGGSSHLLSRL